MLGLFLSTESVMIVPAAEGQNPPPKRDTYSGSEPYRLLAVDAIAIDDEPHVVAIYERAIPSRWQLSIRKQPGEHAED